MTDFIVVIILAVVIGSALRYIIRAKRSGAKCIGCSVRGGCCTHRQTGESSCGCEGRTAHGSEE